MPAIGGVESAAPQRERGETLRRTGLPGDPLPVEGRGEDWIFCGWCVLVERASVERPDGPDDARLEECPSADERRSRHERARPLPPDSIVHDPILGSAADFRRDRGRRPDDDLTSLRRLSDRIRVEQVGATRLPTERSHRRLCGFASCEAHDPVIARDELPNDSAPEHPAGARHEHAHTEVMSIERLNIAGLIVPESGGAQTMVEFDLTDEQRLLQKTAHEFAEREMRPVALEYDKKGTVPWDVIGKAHALGLDTAFIPEAYGGGGIDSALTHVIVNEELNWGCAGMATGLIGAGLAYLPIIHMGTEDQKKRFLTRFTGKEARLGALCLTEPDAGSDVANISTTAKKDGDEWVLNGVKRFITNGGIADIHVVFATLDKSRAHFGIRAFVVEHATPGLKAGKVEDKMGVRAERRERRGAREGPRPLHRRSHRRRLPDARGEPPRRGGRHRVLRSDDDAGGAPATRRLGRRRHRAGRVQVRGARDADGARGD